MESNIQESLAEQCERPQHFKVDQWFQDSPVSGVDRWGSPSDHQIHELKRRKHTRRLEKWWHSLATSSEPLSVPNEKLAEAKRQRFTIEGKVERVAKSLAALSHSPRIQLTRDEWRQIIETQDLEDQFS